MSERIEHRCYRADRCVAWERGPNNTRLGTGINPALGLCDSCSWKTIHALEDLPRDYVELNQQLGKVKAAGGEPVSGTREKPIPIHLHVEALQAEMVHETTSWAESVSEVLGITRDSQHDRDSRQGTRLQNACRLIANSMSVLLALRGATHMAWDKTTSRHEWVDRDGLDAALLFIELHHRSRTMLGLTRLVHRYPTPCPRCEAVALERANGSETIECNSCGSRYTQAQYDEMTSILAGVLGAA